MKQDARRLRATTLALAAALAAPGAARAQERSNFFDDPFVSATSGFRRCPVPEGPKYSAAEVRLMEHERVQHGVSCYQSGRCRLPNSYLYDKELVPRVAQSIQRSGRFDDTSVWVLGQRRVVTLMGCVRSREQAEALEQSVVLVDDVMNVVNLLMVGTRGKPPYRVAPPAGP